jgi:prophage tail gpP-like protein
MILKVKRHFQIDTYNKFSLLLRYDSVASAFSFSFYFDPNNPEHKLLFQPGHYHQIDIEHNGDLLLRGWILSQAFGETSNKVLSSVNGYSLSGVLEDCQIPLSLYPLQADQKNLREIAQRFVSKFPFNVQIDGSVAGKMEQIYDITTAKDSDTMKGYLANLANQKDIVMSHNNKGDLLFTKAKTRSTPIFHFESGLESVVEMSLKFNGQRMHSDITVQKQVGIDGGNAGQSTIENPFVPFVYRPKVVTQSSGDDNDTIEAAKSVRSAELKGLVLTIKTSMWELEGKVIKPNQIITVRNPELYLYKKSNWFIESVQLDGDETSTTSTLTCVLPEVYNGGTPSYIFEINEEKEHG